MTKRELEKHVQVVITDCIRVYIYIYRYVHMCVYVLLS